MFFGVTHYHALDLRESPEVAVAALRMLEEGGPGGASFQGMFTGADKFSRRIRLSEKALRQLVIDLRGGVFSSLLGFRGTRDGTRDQEEASITFGVVPAADAEGFPCSVEYIQAIHSLEDLALAERVSLRLWELFRPSCGVSLLGESYSAVQSELSGIPIATWDAEPDPREEQRLFKIQDATPLFGRYARGPAWGVFLGAHLVEQLGGFERLNREAPVYEVRALEGGGAYLRLTREPVVLKSESYKAAAARLEQFLAPVLPPEPREASRPAQ